MTVFFLSEKRDSFTCLCKSRRTGHIISTMNLDVSLYTPAMLCHLTQVLFLCLKSSLPLSHGKYVCFESEIAGAGVADRTL